MKKIKKLLAMIMAMTMVLGMAMTVSAAPGEDWTISISGTGIEGAEVKYGQLIMANPESTIGWKFVNSTIATDFVSAWNNAGEPVTALTEEEVLRAVMDLGEMEDPENQYSEAGTINGHSQFSAALDAVADDVATNLMTVSEGAGVEESGAGLYIVTAQREGYTYLPMAAYMNSDGTAVEVVAKGAENQLKKTIAESGVSVAPGDTVSYTIQQPYMYFLPNATKNFTITDTITNGTIQTETLKVYYLDASAAGGKVQLNENNDYTVSFSPEEPEVNKTGFTLDFGTLYRADLAGKTLQIEYDVTVGAVTTGMPLSNQAVSSNGTGQIVETKPVSFTVHKVSDEDDAPLSGAVFTHYKEVEMGTVGAVALSFDVNEDGSLDTVYGLEVTTLTTLADGSATVNNLDADITYYIKETTAPKGYSLNDTVYKLTGATATANNPVEVEGENGVVYEKITYKYTDFEDETVMDTKPSALPSTGGIGTTIFTIGGCAIMIAAAALYFASKRKSEEN